MELELLFRLGIFFFYHNFNYVISRFLRRCFPLSRGSSMQELESSLAKKECYIKELETSLTEQKEANNHQYGEVKLLNERLTNEARRIKSLERENDRLHSEISLLESKVGSNNILGIADLFSWSTYFFVGRLDGF